MKCFSEKRTPAGCCWDGRVWLFRVLLLLLLQVLIRKMVMEFIKPKSCVILAVTAANTDLANSDRQEPFLLLRFVFKDNAPVSGWNLRHEQQEFGCLRLCSLQVARQVDPKGMRTVGVLTKVDTLEEGVDCLDALDGKLYPLDSGYAPLG